MSRSQVHTIGRIIRAQLNGSFELRNGSGGIPYLDQRQTQVVVSIRISRLQFDRLTERGNCTWSITGMLQQQSEIILRVGQLRVKFYRELQLLNRLTLLVLLAQRLGKIIMGLSIVRLSFYGIAQQLFCDLRVFLLQLKNAQVQRSRSKVRTEPQRLAELGGSCFGLAPLREQRSQLVVNIGT